MHWKWLYYENTLELTNSIKFIVNDITENIFNDDVIIKVHEKWRNEKNAFQMILL